MQWKLENLFSSEIQLIVTFIKVVFDSWLANSRSFEFRWWSSSFTKLLSVETWTMWFLVNHSIGWTADKIPLISFLDKKKYENFNHERQQFNRQWESTSRRRGCKESHAWEQDRDWLMGFQSSVHRVCDWILAADLWVSWNYWFNCAINYSTYTNPFVVDHHKVHFTKF